MTALGDNKLFVGGLLPYSTDQSLVAYFSQFGEIVEAKVVMDRLTGRSKNYGFVVFRDPESASAAAANAYPYIDGKQCNCNLASMHVKDPSRVDERRQLGKRPPPFQNPGYYPNGPYAPKRMKLDEGGPGPVGPGAVSYKPTYLQILQTQQPDLTAESAMKKIGELKESDPSDALRYFLEVGELFQATGEYDASLKDLIEKAREFRLKQALDDGLAPPQAAAGQTAAAGPEENGGAEALASHFQNQLDGEEGDGHEYHEGEQGGDVAAPAEGGEAENFPPPEEATGEAPAEVPPAEAQ